jgi:L-cysteine desulfidase
MPEAKPLILVHAEWGERTRTAAVSAAIGAAVALAFYRVLKFRRILAFITTIIAAGACYCAFKAAEHGGAMVYHHGVGVKITPSGPTNGSGSTGSTPAPAASPTPGG